MLNITEKHMAVLGNALEREISEGGPLEAIYTLRDDALTVGEVNLSMDLLDELDGVVNREMEAMDEADGPRDNEAYALLLNLYDQINEYREELYAA